MLTPRPAKPSYLAFLGRIAREKRVDRAIRIAARAGLPIKIAAKIDRADRDYFESEIKHLFALPHVEYIGEIDDAAKPEFLSGAIALLSPIDWEEPFGLVMIEAAACGTPAIVWSRGAAPEIVEPGVTGYLVDNEEEAAVAVEMSRNLSREAIRRHFEERFTARRMANDYLNVYRGLLEQPPATALLKSA